MALIVFNDTETTGIRRSMLHLDGGDKILESAFAVYKYSEKTGNLTFVEYLEEKIEPGLPISPGAAMTHGIWYPDLKGAPTFDKSKTKKRLLELIAKGAYYCAHNTPFDTAMLEKEGVFWPHDKRIDTLVIARGYETGPEIESKSLQWLRYHYDFDQKKDFPKLVKKFGIDRLQAHTALSDIVVLIYYFKMIVKKFGLKNLSDLVAESNKIIREETIEWGNVIDKGSRYEDIIGTTYMQWGKMKTVESYLLWGITNIDHMSIDRKISISYYVIKGFLNGKIHNRKDITAMLSIASAFIPELWSDMKAFGINGIEEQRKRVYDVIEAKIDKLIADGLSEDDPSLIEKAHDLKYGYQLARRTAEQYVSE